MKSLPTLALVALALVASTAPISAASPAAAPAAAVAYGDPQVGPHARDEARHAHDPLSFTPSRIATIPRRSVKAPMQASGAKGAAAPLSPAGPSGTLQREVFGFAPYWTISDEASWNYTLLSTVAYFGLTINADGSINQSDQGWTGWNSSDLADSINRAHAVGDKVVLVIKPYACADPACNPRVTAAQTVNAIVTNSSATTATITNAIAQATSKQLDGINVDFEGTSNGYPSVQAGFTNFVKKLRGQAPTPWQITADTYSGSASVDTSIFRIEQLAPYVDWLFVMAYDMNFDNMPGHAGPTAPLNGWTYNDTTSVQQYLAKAGSPSKVILGVPYYGYKWCTTSQLAYAATQLCPADGKGGTADTYSQALQDSQCALQWRPGWDATAQSPWASWSSPATNDPCSPLPSNQGYNSWRELYDENGASLGLKYDLVNNNNLRGTGMWALGFDGSSPDLWNELYLKFGPWRSWQSLGGTLTTAPATSSWGNGRLDVFARGTDGVLWHKWWGGNAWSIWERLGGQLTANPAAVSWGPNRIDLFTRGTDNALWHRWWDGRAWGNWESLGGVLSSGPTVASWGSGRLDVFGRGTDNALWHKWWDGRGWGPWERLGDQLTSDPGAVSSGSGLIDVFYRATDRTLWHRAWNGSSWSSGESLGGILNTGPGASSWGAGHLDVFVEGSDTALWHRAFDGGAWAPWQRLGGALSADPSAVSWGVGRIDVFSRASDGSLSHLWYQSG